MDIEKFSELSTKYHAYFIDSADRFTRNRPHMEAEDIVQNAFVNGLTFLSRLDWKHITDTDFKKIVNKLISRAALKMITYHGAAKRKGSLFQKPYKDVSLSRELSPYESACLKDYIEAKSRGDAMMRVLRERKNGSAKLADAGDNGR